MGLDSYLMKMPRYNGATARDVSAVESYLSWKEKGTEYTLEEWCGLNKPPAQEYIDFYNEFYVAGDYGFKHITEDVGYWRKANAIHNWFVEKVQDGVDDCRYHREVIKEDIEELLDTCQKVLDASTLVNYTEDYQVVEDYTVAEELLPTVGGFFFGDTTYDEWYIKDIEHTIDILTRVLDTTDFETEMLYYVSSW